MNGKMKVAIMTDLKKIEFTETDDFSKLQGQGIQSLPIMEIDGEILTFVEANNWINNQQ